MKNDPYKILRIIAIILALTAVAVEIVLRVITYYAAANGHVIPETQSLFEPIIRIMLGLIGIPTGV